MKKLKRQKDEYLKRLKSWKVRGLKELTGVNSFSGCTYAGAVTEPRMIKAASGDERALTAQVRRACCCRGLYELLHDSPDKNWVDGHFWSWLKKMSTGGMMQLNSFRKKLKVSSSSSLTNPPTSHTVIGSNSPYGFKTLDDVTFVLKHSVHGMDMEVPSYCACCWESVCYHSIKHTGSLGRSWKKSRESSQVREELIN